MRRQLAAAALILSAISIGAQTEQVRPHSMYESPAGLAAASLAASTAGTPAELLTTGEKTSFEKTGLYKEVLDLEALYEKRSKYIHTITYGTTPEGRPMTALIVSKDRAFTPEAAHKTDKAIVLVQSGIHSGEIEGKDTALMLVRDMAITNHQPMASWLDHVIFIVIPLYEIDGHEDRTPFNRANQQGPDITGTRPQEQGLNLNRDYIKTDAPETRAFMRLYNSWLPDFMFDNHVTDGADYQYDVTWDMTQHNDIGAASRAWVTGKYVPSLNKQMEAQGHLVLPYGALRGDGPGSRGPGAAAATAPATKPAYNVEVFSPRYSHYWSGARNRPCLLVETHSLKTAKTRAWSNYDIMVDSINVIADDPQALRKAVRDSDAADAALAGHRDQQMFLGGKVGEGSHPLLYRGLKRATSPSPITGSPVMNFTAEKDDITVDFHDTVDTTAEAPVPLGFLIPIAFKNIADQLETQGVTVERTPRDLSDQPFETWRFTDAAKQTFPFEGRTFTDYKLTPVTEKMHMPAGSYYVPMNQPRARIIMQMLHPAAPDALMRWGFLDAVFGEGRGRIGAAEYLSVPIATKMAVDNPALLTEFQAKVAAGPTFAKDSAARLKWWTERSNYQPTATNKYPIAEVWTKTW